ncbi:NADAR family protein [Mesorhizobium sp. CN2-181]|uniref:NADAR family protein n=1 Tax=Mesorhizobium yinganensis TaxID=3157707 RepID=UPI0032B84E6A
MRENPKIDAFQGNYRFLSNFWMAPIQVGLLTFASTEHAYQAAKSLDPDDWRKIQDQRSATYAKIAGGKFKLRPDWHEIRVDVMRELTAAKYDQHEDLRAKLIATKGIELIEGNTWNDTFWGVCCGKGENWLGRILMEYRDR